ncbi:Bug family tripartite tricarboxylate transporter substrate binding protein [Aquabacterium sp. J223]|uniref:Bug family tripartite tricarboxylate transporter substrate binding protein n=1 Tax=Aquabacterium sp. J223 TaxID=2898431 RepID=UPI0021AD75E7|nr:tripartite tricarboxylate transporter substrate binding protein [Aquabacterium sp. J223]UUX93985.1 tripartite tricarboxylate transporter substrate binding protein [Aquabacterium sp. J223]
MRTRRLLLTAVLALATSAAAHAQAWPARPVKIVVPYPPGGSVDVVTRKMAAKLQEQTGQTFFVENKAGATGTIGLASVVQSPPDGYTLAANDTTYALLPHIFKKLPFDHEKDLLPVGAYVFAPMGVVVRADSRHRTLADLLAAAKGQPDKVTYGTGGAGTTPHFVSEALGIAAGVNFMHVPYKGAGEATMAMLSGTIDFQVASTPGVMGNVQGGKARLLAVSGGRRLAALPDVPTFGEAGLKNFGLINFTGLWAPKGTPQAVIDRLQKELATAMASADMKAFSESIASEPGFWDAATFAKDLHERTAAWGKVVAHTAFERQ